MHTWQLVLILLILGILYYLVNYTEYNDIGLSKTCDKKEMMTNNMLENILNQNISEPSLPQLNSPQPSLPQLNSPQPSLPQQSLINEMYNNISSDAASVDSNNSSSNVSNLSNTSSATNMTPNTAPKVESTTAPITTPNIAPITAPNVTLITQKPPENTLSEFEQNKIAQIKSGTNDNDSSHSDNESECEPEEKKCTAKTCGFNNLHPILDPRFNMREAAKQCILLEDHLNNSKKRCMDCINKHFLTVDGFLEEAVSLEQDIAKREFYRDLYLKWVDIQKRYVLQKQKPENMDLISKEIRMFRKPLVEKYFDTVSEYSE
jgi:hypothetical protein